MGKLTKSAGDQRLLLFSLYTVGPYIFGYIIATGGSACDVTHTITSIIQSFVNKCNNSNSCKLFYLDYKSMLIHKLPQMPFPLDWQVWVQENTVYSAFSIFISWWTMDLVGKPNTTSPIWNHFDSYHPSAFVKVSSSSRDRKRPAGQVCIGEAFSKLAKYE